MPRRSNEFQRLVKAIYHQIKPEGASVTESAMVRERGSTVEREVDVLVETPIGDTVVRLAVECRDRARPDDIEWIDQLIGKYRDLPIDKIVAVSASGLTKAAEEKALANRIEVRTLTEALETDWPAEFAKTQIANLNINVRATNYCVFTDPEWPDPGPPVRVQFGAQDMNRGRFEEMLTEIGHAEILRILETKSDHPLRRLENLNRGYEMDFDLRVTEPITMTSAHGSEHRLLHMILRCKTEFSYRDLPVKRHLFGNVGVTVATDSEQSPMRVVKVQMPGSDPADGKLSCDPDEK